MKKIDAVLMSKYVERELSALGTKSERWEKYFRGVPMCLCELTDGTVYCIGKRKIETEFCFGENGYDYHDACKAANEARRNENIFRLRNLRWIDECIDMLADSDKRVWMFNKAGTSDALYSGSDWFFDDAIRRGAVELGAEDRGILLKIYRKVREDFSKRIDNYLARYGLSKVHSWTYWVDA